MNDQPLVHTTRGNLPVNSLRYQTAWHDGPDQVVFKESFFLGDELVRESVHVMLRQGAAAAPQQASI